MLQVPADMVCRVWLLKDQVLLEAELFQLLSAFLILQVPLEAELFPCLVWLLIVLIQEVALQFLRLTLLTQGGGICL